MVLTSASSSLVDVVSLPEQKVFGGLQFPLVLSPSRESGLLTLEDVIQWAKNEKAIIEERLQKHGAIFFRGFPLPTAIEFNTLLEAFDYPELPYVGGAAPRTSVVGRVFTANEAPPHLFIPFHHEMAQVPEYPSKVFFYCERAPSEGGQTPLLLSHEVFRRMQEEFPAFVSELEKKGLTYTRVLGQGDDNTSAIGRGWQSTFLTTDKQEAELKAAKLGVNLEWLPNGAVKTRSGPLAALKRDAVTGRSMWFNSMVAAYTGWEDALNTAQEAVTFGDGTPLPQAAVLRCAELMDELAVDIPWQARDWVLLNNHSVQHARRSFRGPRRVLASLVKAS